jgi:GNAT superfamily N-acetyltransferase
VDGILQGHFGEVRADLDLDAHAASLSLGPFTFLGGDCDHSFADELIGQLADFCVILVADRTWHQKITAWEGSKTDVAQRHVFSDKALDRIRLQALASEVPDGFEIRAIDSGLAGRMLAEVSENLVPDLFWKSSDDFIKRGFGYCALSNGRVEAGVTSALLIDAAAGIQINTNPGHQGKGLATALGARFLLDCLDRGIEPHWDTGDPASYHLAEKLGYQLAGAYSVLEWDPQRK